MDAETVLVVNSIVLPMLIVIPILGFIYGQRKKRPD